MSHRVPGRVAVSLLVLTVVAGCGKKDPPPAPPTAPVAAADTATAAPDTAPAAEADTAAAPAPTADTTAPTSGLPAAVTAALNGAAAGCVGFAADGGHALILVDGPEDDGVARRALWVDLREGGASETAAGSCPGGVGCGEALAAATVAAREEILGLTAGAALIPCHAAAAQDGAAEARPRGKVVRVVGGTTLTADAAGGRKVFLDEIDPVDDEEGAALRVVTAYWDEDGGAVLVAAVRGGADAGDLAFYGVSAAELGIAPCVARPTGGTRATAKPAPVTLAELPSEGCQALTKDGGAALFVVFRKDSLPGEGGDADEDEARSLRWFGAGEHPTIDLACHLTEGGCSEAQMDAIAKALAAAGLVACRELGPAVIDGFEVGTVAAERNRLWLQREGGAPRWIGDLTMSAHDGGDHESFEAAYQHPAGGPVFALIENADTGLREVRVRVLDDAALGFCALPAAAAPTPAPR